MLKSIRFESKTYYVSVNTELNFWIVQHYVLLTLCTGLVRRTKSVDIMEIQHKYFIPDVIQVSRTLYISHVLYTSHKYIGVVRY